MNSVFKKLLLVVFLFSIYLTVPFYIFFEFGNFIALIFKMDKTEFEFMQFWSFLFVIVYLSSAHSIIYRYLKKNQILVN